MSTLHIINIFSIVDENNKIIFNTYHLMRQIILCKYNYVKKR